MNMRVLTLIVCSCVAVCGQNATGAPKRTVFESNGANLKKPEPPKADAAKPRDAAPENTRGASTRALDSLASSIEDLNGIRDSNVRSLTKDGCAPEVSARIADLKARLRAATGLPDLAGKSSPRTSRDSGSETLTLASNWFKSSSAGSSLAAKDKSNELLDSVLPDSSARRPADLRADLRMEERDAAGLKSEIEHLLSTCPDVKR